MPPKIYFYCSPDPENLQDDIVVIADGLRSLGIPYFASHNYWRRSLAPDDFLLRATPGVAPEDCDVVVVPYTWFNWVRLGLPTTRRDFPPALFQPNRRYRTVYLDINDGLRTVSWEPAFRQFDLILRTKLNRRVWHPANLRPWVLGMSERMIRSTAESPPFSEKVRRVSVNFGASHNFPHTARIRAARDILPQLRRHFPIEDKRDNLSQPPANPWGKLMWEQTNHRHSDAYYERVGASQMVACFCGDLIPSLPWHNPGRYLVGGNRAKVKMAFYRALSAFDPRPDRIAQWDSWRFWETLAAGSVAINLDLPRYGAQLPVMPENWKHYVGIDFSRATRDVDRLASLSSGELAAIASAGQKWAFANYSPPAMARRFLAELGFLDVGYKLHAAPSLREN